MAVVRIRDVKGGKSGKSFPVGYDADTKGAYVLYLGSWSNIGRASSPQDAMTVASAWAWDK